MGRSFPKLRRDRQLIAPRALATYLQGLQVWRARRPVADHANPTRAPVPEWRWRRVLPCRLYAVQASVNPALYYRANSSTRRSKELRARAPSICCWRARRARARNRCGRPRRCSMQKRASVIWRRLEDMLEQPMKGRAGGELPAAAREATTAAAVRVRRRSSQTAAGAGAPARASAAADRAGRHRRAAIRQAAPPASAERTCCCAAWSARHVLPVEALETGQRWVRPTPPSVNRPRSARCRCTTSSASPPTCCCCRCRLGAMPASRSGGRLRCRRAARGAGGTTGPACFPWRRARAVFHAVASTQRLSRRRLEPPAARGGRRRHVAVPPGVAKTVAAEDRRCPHVVRGRACRRPAVGDHYNRWTAQRKNPTVEIGLPLPGAGELALLFRRYRAAVAGRHRAGRWQSAEREAAGRQPAAGSAPTGQRR